MRSSLLGEAGIESALSEVCESLWRNAKCVFFLSTGRVGTKSLHQIFAKSGGAQSYHEPAPRFIELKQAGFEQNIHSKTTMKTAFVHGRWRRLLKARLSGKTYIETSSRLTFFSNVLPELLPNSKFVFVHRHPAEVVRSGVRRGWYLNHRADQFRIVPTEGSEYRCKWNELNQFQKNCWYWSACNRYILNALQNIPDNRVMLLPAKDLFEASAAVRQKLESFSGVGLPIQEEFAELLTRKSNAQKVGEFPAFEDWSEEQRQQLYSIAQKEIYALGYSKFLNDPDSVETTSSGI